MRRVRVVGFAALLILLGIGILSPVVWGEITLHPGESGEAQWWYREDPLVGQWVCGSGGPFCNPTTFDANRWGVELATYADGDWAYVSLNTEKRFNIDDVTTASFLFRMVDPPGVQTDSGPSMAFSLVGPGGVEVIAISAGPTSIQTTPCTTFDPTAVDWWWGTWEETTQPSGKQWDPSTIDTSMMPGPVPDTFANMLTILAGYQVKSVMILMGVVGETVGSPSGGPIFAGKTVVDDITLEWTSGAVSYGGKYRLEKGWPEIVNFDDWTQTPLPNGEPPRQFDQWCVGCNDCLTTDNQNLWGIVHESNLNGLDIPAVAKSFPSHEYAIYFGITTTGNYNAGEASVGAVCSPLNELNPADEYVSISFDYFREVEQYMGPYDWTYVQIQFLDDNNDPAAGWAVPAGWYDPFDYTTADLSNRNPGDVHPLGPTGHDPATEIVGACSGTDLGWKTIWYKDSSDANEGDWETATISHYLDSDENQQSDPFYRIKIPPKATRMRIRFVFNSVDGSNNDNFGWLIDNVVKEHSPSPVGCKIETESLPQGVVGEKYGTAHPDGTYFELQPQVIDGAATGAREWSIVSVTKDGRTSSLPRRLALDPRGRLYGQLDPGTSGTYEITFMLECFDGRPDTKTLILNVRAPASGVSILGTEDFDDPGDDGLNTSATNTVDGAPLPTVAGSGPNLWHQTANVKYALDTLSLKSDYHHVAYFGKDDDGKPVVSDDPNYSLGRAKGCMITRQFHVTATADGQELIVGFKSWRNVEYFTGGEYDKTWVDVQFEGGNWQTIWSKSSMDPSLAAWTWQEVHTGLQLKQGVKVRLRFCFDSVDGYNNGKDGEAYGWLVDEITLYAGSAELSISSCPKGETSVGEYYNEEIRASGGEVNMPRWEIASGALPPGLGLIQPDPTVDRRLAHIEGVPRTAGTYTFTLRVRDDDWKEVASRECTIVVTEDVTLLYEDFEDDPGWGQGGLWHFTTDNGVAGVDNTGAANHAAYYGQNDTTNPNYKTGSRTSGMLTLVTPTINLAEGPGGTPIEAVKISFKSWRDVESFAGGGYDQTQVQVKLDDHDWVTVWSLDSADASGRDWKSVEVPAFRTDGASTMSIRFVFDSVDKWYNNYTGWLVDDVSIQSAPVDEAGPLSAMAAGRAGRPRGLPTELEVINIPNPIRDVHTTTFMVRNADVEAMRIEIYDLAGTLVFEDEVQGNELVWHTDNDYGEYLANGVYIYRAYVLIDGKWIVTKAQKLLILR